MRERKISPHEATELAACFSADAGKLFGYACVLTREDRALAEELVQAVFTAASQTWPVLRDLPAEQRLSWLRRTLGNIAINGFRREPALRDRLPRIEVRYRKIPAGPPEQAFSTTALERCWRIIQDMPERQHTVAVARWQLDMKQDEIAAVLGMTEKTVSAHLHRARRRLITQLGRDYPPDGDDAAGAPS